MLARLRNTLASAGLGLRLPPLLRLKGPAASYHLARWLFIRALGLAYLIAFTSLGSQIIGLSGSQGIQPATQLLDVARRHAGNECYWKLPTLAWFTCSDEALSGSCIAGAILALLVIVRVLPALALLLLWALYLSLCSICTPFLNFQWDILLLETGFLAVFFESWRPLPRLRIEPAPSRMALWLIRCLLFKLMFLSGAVKLLSQDEVWWNLTALNVHYETQPLPTWIGWYAHQLPQWFQKMSVATMFFIELVVSFLIFAPRPARLFAFFVLLLFQVLILLTGNYTFFNLLTIALCLSLVDDAFLRLLCPKNLLMKVEWTALPPKRFILMLRNILLVPVAASILLISAAQMLNRCSLRNEWTSRLNPIMKHIQPFRCINAYGLFANMTTSRPEIVVEGSADGRNWLAYEFKWKPGDLTRRPAFVAPHQPRLDWQMWFAALGSARNNRWFVNFAQRLLEGSPPVLDLLKHNPFPDHPPRYIRALVYDYRFSTLAEREQTGDWWRRDQARVYLPPQSLQGGR